MTVKLYNMITLFTDASYSQIWHRASWAAWAKFNDSRTMRYSGKLRGDIKDSGVAEYKALANGLFGVVRFFNPPKNTFILCQTDCTDLIAQIINLQSPTTKEPERLLVLNHIRAFVREHELGLRAKHVKGHRGNQTPRHAVNTWCDAECRRHMGEILERERLSA